MWTHGHFQWHELNTRDPERAKAFYSRTMGWRFEELAQPDGPYWLAKVGDEPVAGIFSMEGPEYDGIPEHWFPFIAVDDVDSHVYAVAAAGGLVLRTPWHLPGVGRVAILRDGTGAAVGWLTPEPGAVALAG
jgi:predicted enzyme related to lactoylglutathione lyase